MSNITSAPPIKLVQNLGFSEQELARITDPKLRRELGSVRLSWNALEIIGSFNGSSNLSRLSDVALSNSQFALGQYSILVGRVDDVKEINDNVDIASGLKLKCAPKVSLFRCLNNQQDAILVLEWPARIENLAKVEELSGPNNNPDYSSFASDMRELLTVNRFHEYALIGSAHHYVDKTGQYPYIVVDVWNSFKRPEPSDMAGIECKINALEKRR